MVPGKATEVADGNTRCVQDLVGARLPPVGTPRERVRAILHEAMPNDGPRATEASIAFSFVTLGLSKPSLAAVRRKHFDDMYAMCRKLVTDPAANDLLAPPISDPDLLVARLHALVDGLSLHGLAGHRTASEMIAQLDAFLDEILVD
ncbi:TetR family transcriptional regulator C-terminal domain-containing protein [Nocardia brasiliensis]